MCESPVSTCESHVKHKSGVPYGTKKGKGPKGKNVPNTQWIPEEALFEEFFFIIPNSGLIRRDDQSMLLGLSDVTLSDVTSDESNDDSDD